MQRLHALRQAAKKILEWCGLCVESDENKFLPYSHAHGYQAILAAVKIAHSVEIGSAFQRAVGAIRPSVIRTAEIRCAALGIGHDRGGMVLAYVIERP